MSTGKRSELVRDLLRAGLWQVPSGHTADHDKFSDGTVTVFVPRHKEINKWTERKIRKDAGIL